MRIHSNKRTHSGTRRAGFAFQKSSGQRTFHTRRTAYCTRTPARLIRMCSLSVLPHIPHAHARLPMHVQVREHTLAREHIRVREHTHIPHAHARRPTNSIAHLPTLEHTRDRAHTDSPRPTPGRGTPTPTPTPTPHPRPHERAQRHRTV